MDFFRQHPAVVGTLLYFLANVVGSAYLWALFREFGINAFDFTEANDFLLAAFREPTTLLLAAFAAAFAVGGALVYKRVMLSLVLDSGDQSKARSDEHRANADKVRIWLGQHSWIGWLVLFLLSTTVIGWVASVVAEDNANQIRTGERFNLRVYLNPARTGHAPQPVFESSALIGTTETLLFLLNKSRAEPSGAPQREDVVAVPRSSIHHIEFPPLAPVSTPPDALPSARTAESIGPTGGEFAVAAYFAHGGDQILNEATLRDELTTLRAKLEGERRPVKYCDARLIAAADRSGDVKANFGLAARRAAAFQGVLDPILTVDPLIIVAGETALAVHTRDGAAEALNRRVVLELRCDWQG